MRDNTRITFPSTAGSGIPYAILKIAPFVYGPFNFSIFFTSLGTTPPYTFLPLLLPHVNYVL